MTSLFVYGSLQPGGANEHALAAIDRTWLGAAVLEHLEEAGWGIKLSYQGLRLVYIRETIEGSLLTLASLHTFWHQLEAFEGDEYERFLNTVTLYTGENLTVFVYALRRPTK